MVELCVLCLKSTSTEANKKKSKLLIDLLEMLSLDSWWNTANSSCPTLCNNCMAIVVKALDFKTNCLETEKTLSPYVKGNAKVDLCSVYLKKMRREGEPRLWEIMRICRVCIRLINNFECYLLDFLEQNHLEDIFKKYIPEMEPSKFEEPLICQQCIDNFKNFSDFITSCIDTKNKIKKYCDASHISTTKQVDLKDVLRHSMKDILGGDVCYKLKKIDRNNSLNEPLLLISHIKEEYDTDTEVDVESVDILSEPSEDQSETRENEPIQKFNHFNFFTLTENKIKNCNHCDYKTSCKWKITRHARVNHGHLYNFPVFHCDKCNYKSTEKDYLKRHYLTHSDSSQDPSTKYSKTDLYHCEKCTFKTLRKDIYKQHLLTHMDSKDVPSYECKICSFSTKYKSGLKQHMKTHMDRSRIAIFKCHIGGCNYSTIEKSYLKKHIKRHKTPCLDKVDTLYCHQCPFKTEYKKHMRSHAQLHVNGQIDRSILRCEHNYCKYKTRMEENMDEHYEKEHGAKS
ncbi:unnamed protein product [Phaedon cochleariae]|uniref:C2H2-type domain-containing protein n=1 Tax=Phaedon cochleariae TaxID=80249 RepID=A0A9P0DSY4_PHACE|nr:unnamed protein product [Phaedon cochleariae]